MLAVESCTAGSQKPPSSAKNRKTCMRRIPWIGSPSRAEPPSAPLAARRPVEFIVTGERQFDPVPSSKMLADGLGVHPTWAVDAQDAALRYTASLARTGFFGPDSWYMNNAANAAYAAQAKNGGKLSLPVLFFHGAYDYTCETIVSRFAEPMRRDCDDLSEVVVPSGNWIAQERPVEVNTALVKWLATRSPNAWPA